MSWQTSNRRERLPPDWDDLSSQVLVRDGRRCKISLPGCKLLATEVDHIRPGDDHRPENLRAACEACHARKSSQEGHAAKARKRAAGRRKPERHPGFRSR